MKQIIILEGPDNIGKSYLANELHNELVKLGKKNVSVRHFGAPVKKGREILQEQVDRLENEMKGIRIGDGIEIWDRSIIGEAVYGPLYRKDAYPSEVYWKELAEHCQAAQRSILVVVFHATLPWYKKMHIKPKADEVQAYQSMVDAEKVSNHFVHVVSKLPLKYRLLVNCNNYLTHDVRNSYVIARIRMWLNRRPFEHGQTNNYRHTFFNEAQNLWEGKAGFNKKHGAAYECDAFEEKTCEIGRDHREFALFGKQCQRPTNGCGAVKGVKYIFVGEAPGGNGCGKLGIPFYDDVSGNLLQTALDALGILPTHYYMTNVIKCTPKNNRLDQYVITAPIHELQCVQALKGEVEDIQKKNSTATVVALGKVASKELARLGIDHVMMYHPAYYLRIGTRDQFTNDLKKTLAWE